MEYNCSAPNSAPTSAELSQYTAVRGNIIIHIPTLLYSLSLSLSTLLLLPGKRLLTFQPKIKIMTQNFQDRILGVYQVYPSWH